MDENPYRSPQAEQTSASASLPAWRHVVSILLIFLGVCYLVFIPVAIVIAINHRSLEVAVWSAAFYGILGYLLTWGGMRIRRRKPTGD